MTIVFEMQTPRDAVNAAGRCPTLNEGLEAMTILRDAAAHFQIESDPEPDLDRRLDELCRETYHDELPPEVTDAYEPSQDDLEWVAIVNVDSFVARNLPFADWLEEQARQHRLREDDRHQWLGATIDRIAQTVRWSGASSPAEHDDRMEVYDRELRERHYQDGYADGAAATRR